MRGGDGHNGPPLIGVFFFTKNFVIVTNYTTPTGITT
jgi:hypothetical protein